MAGWWAARRSISSSRAPGRERCRRSGRGWGHLCGERSAVWPAASSPRGSPAPPRASCGTAGPPAGRSVWCRSPHEQPVGTGLASTFAASMVNPSPAGSARQRRLRRCRRRLVALRQLTFDTGSRAVRVSAWLRACSALRHGASRHPATTMSLMARSSRPSGAGWSAGPPRRRH